MQQHHAASGRMRALTDVNRHRGTPVFLPCCSSDVLTDLSNILQSAAEPTLARTIGMENFAGTSWRWSRQVRPWCSAGIFVESSAPYFWRVILPRRQRHRLQTGSIRNRSVNSFRITSRLPPLPSPRPRPHLDLLSPKRSLWRREGRGGSS